jgi:hypothetical protein
LHFGVPEDVKDLDIEQESITERTTTHLKTLTVSRASHFVAASWTVLVNLEPITWVIEKGFEIIFQPTINQTAALNLLRRFLQDPAARERLSPWHYPRIYELTQTDHLWIQESAKMLKSSIEFYSLHQDHRLEEPITRQM